MKLIEMTALAGNQEHFLKQYVNNALSKREHFTHIGDIEHNCQVWNFKEQYLLFNKNTFIAYFYIENKDNRHILKLAFVEQQFRRNNFFSKFIWFVIKHTNIQSLEISDVHSKDTYEALKKLSNRLDLFWKKGNEREKYDPNNLEKFYGVKPTGWVVIIENEYDFSEWPKFFDLEKPDFRQHYDWLLEKI